jgi:hypothetical protein
MSLLTKEFVARDESLDSLWTQAEALGKVSVENPLFSTDYRVEIVFSRPNGSVIRARGQADHIRLAMARSIMEAKLLKEA